MHARPRLPGVTYGVLALVFVLLLAIFALTQRQPPPPTIAEFAPQALENITDAPNDQSSSSGRGGGLGGDGGGGLGAVASPTPQAIDVPRVRRCVGDPPRQIEDPQSPPCVPYWSGDNGGATYKGVTRNEIRFAYTENNDWVHNIIAFFNKRFEFYGRKIVEVQYSPACSDDGTGDAVAIDEQVHAFMAYPIGCDGNGYFMHMELAKRGVISTTATPILAEDLHLRPKAPALWEYQMSLDKIFQTWGRWACKRLAGRNATHAGDASLINPRKFGIMMDRTNFVPESKITTEPLTAELSACGITAKEVEYESPNAANVLLQMRQAGVTSIFCQCHIVSMKVLGETATAQSYFPEWLLSSSTFVDFNGNMRTLGPGADQRKQMFGLTMQPKQVIPDLAPTTWAQREVQPGYIYRGSFIFATENYQYWALLELASGIQMAGPQLSAQTFEQGLHKTKFPNPNHQIMAGRVGFEDHDHSMTDDAAEWWWSEHDISPYPDEGAGTMCYVNHGARHTLTQWPDGEPDPFFSGPCDSGLS